MSIYRHCSDSGGTLNPEPGSEASACENADDIRRG
jgi:hypothetical protein